MTADERPILTPSQLNTLAKNVLEDTFPSVWIEAELGSVARPASGHLYLTLKDERAQVKAAMFRGQAIRLRFVPREGQRVLARGRLTLYEARGEYQLVLEHMEEAGEGALRRAFEQLKAKLQAEGLFDAERKRALPALPKRIAVITSPSGAVIRDIIHVLTRRFPLLEIDVLPTLVQGDGAAAQVTSLLKRADATRRFDVIVLARGGGSLEDLWAFNDETLVRTIAACQTPVVSAIGHETDFTLADFAADLRAPTPSAAAEVLAPDVRDLAAQLQGLQRHLQRLQAQRLHNAMQRADRAALRLNALRPQARLQLMQRRQEELQRRLQAAWQRRLDGEHAKLRHAAAVLRATQPQRRLAMLRERLQGLRPRAQAAVARQLQNDALKLRGLARSLEAVSPLATVARGYSILQKEDGAIVRSTSQVQGGDALRAKIADGELKLRVE